MKRGILIVEDHDVVRESFVDLITLEPDLEVSAAVGTGSEALAWLSEERVPGLVPDLVLVDVSLPEMSGISLIQRLREEHPRLKTLVVSGHEQDLYARQAEEAGAAGYVSKYEAAQTLLPTIRRVLGETG